MTMMMEFRDDPVLVLRCLRGLGYNLNTWLWFCVLYLNGKVKWIKNNIFPLFPFSKEEGQCDFDKKDGQQIYDDCFDNLTNYLYISLSDVVTHMLQYKMDVFLKKLNSNHQIFFDELEKRITKKCKSLNEFGNGTFIIDMWLCDDMTLYWYDLCKISNDEDSNDDEEKIQVYIL
ncbi:hypothetical protein RFI_36272 [Reticulomyxa filosa]|uniref:Uncharacterized protein n=1 Tax=Reticulomyxa filosa TaxID=46433 RepID=X6LGP8_RETFI|nr:hypothetical protein RFI_36272 [Reticulomyxa filosa]|eukprot:ETO01168.1 hypothetical protein RFI_36272 [Reticulomyxa filosa]